MAVLKKSKIGSKLMTIILVVAVLAVGVPLVSAYEAHMVNVTAHVEEPFNCFKTIEPASPGDIEMLEGLGYILEEAGAEPGDTEEVPINTCVVWLLTIYVGNPHSYNMTDVIVWDRFGAELGGMPLDEDVPVDLFVKEHSRGKSKKSKHTDNFTSQYRITWYVTYEEGAPFPDEDPENWNWDIMEPGDMDFLQLLVWTKLNPAGHQSYTSTGTYTLNSGPTAKWYDAPPAEGGHKFSFDGDSLYITAY